MQITLKAARVNCGLKQNEAAKCLGVDKSTLGNWENGKTFPTADRLAQMCKLYGVGIDDIFLLKQ